MNLLCILSVGVNFSMFFKRGKTTMHIKQLLLYKLVQEKKHFFSSIITLKIRRCNWINTFVVHLIHIKLLWYNKYPFNGQWVSILLHNCVFLCPCSKAKGTFKCYPCYLSILRSVLSSPLPTKLKGTLGLHSVRQSVRLSILQSGKSALHTFFVMLEVSGLIFGI